MNGKSIAGNPDPRLIPWSSAYHGFFHFQVGSMLGECLSYPTFVLFFDHPSLTPLSNAWELP